MRKVIALAGLLLLAACAEKEPLSPSPRDSVVSPALPPSRSLGVVSGEVITLAGAENASLTAHDVNSAGMAVGEYYDWYGSGGSGGWTYPPATALSSVRNLTAVNAAGVLAGNSNDGNTGVVILTNGSIVSLTNLPGGPYPHTEPNDMNDAGEVVGWSTGGSDSFVHGVVWSSPTAAPQELPSLLPYPSIGYPNGMAPGLSGSNRLVAGYSLSNPGGPGTVVKPTAWRGLVPFELPGLPGLSNSGGQAYGAGDNGMIVGYVPMATGQVNPVVWQDNTLLADLSPICLTLTGYPYGVAYDIAVTASGRVLIAGWCGGYQAVVFYSKADGSFGGEVLGNDGEATAVASSGYIVGRSMSAAVRWHYAPPTEIPPTIPQPSPPDLSSGQDHNCGVRTDGTVLCWGNNNFGQVAVPSGLTAMVQVALGHSHSCALRNDGTVTCWGLNGNGQATPPVNLTTTARIGAGDFHSCAVSTTGVATCWGRNSDGQATVPADLGPVTRIVGGNVHSCALRYNGTVRCWGNNNSGQTAVPAGLTSVAELAAGALHTCARKSDGSVTCWGWNGSGESTPPPGLTAVQIGAGRQHTCAVTTASTVRCWGLENVGQTLPPAGLSSVVQVDAGMSHSCARKSDHSLTCWGSNSLGQAPVPVSFNLLALQPQIIVFTSTPPEFGQIGSTYLVTATGGGSGNPVIFFSGTPGICEVDGDVVILLSPGQCDVLAEQHAGNGFAHGMARQSFQIIAGATPTGDLVPVVPNGNSGSSTDVSMIFSSVTEPGVTTVTTVPAEGTGSAPPPAGFQLGTPPLYYEIETTATFSGLVQVCIRYQDSQFANESTLRLLHLNTAGVWEDITSSHNTSANVICGHTTSFSPFALGVNLPPEVTRTILPPAPIPLSSSLEVRAEFQDPTEIDVHSGAFMWGDGTTTAAAVTSPTTTAPGRLVASHTYTQAGVYVVNATLSDGISSVSRSSADDDPAYVVVYDPDGGFVTGGGWVNSPSEACPELCQGATGKAHFGFVAKYVRGATEPVGNTEFQFKAGGLNFASDSYQWLVVAGTKAQFKGVGTINGSGTYGFLISAIDGTLDDGTGADRFRIKLWDISAGGKIVYDNEIGTDESAEPTTMLGGGSVTIRK